MIDLHVHTTRSDGQYSPTQILQLAAAGGLSAIAITDHDTVDGLEEGAAAATALHINFIPGIEISVRGARELHILGYGIDPRHPGLLELCREFSEQRKMRKGRILSFLAEQGIPLTGAQVDRHVTNGLVGRPHVARAMLDAGYVSSIEEAFTRYLSTSAFERIDRPKPSPHDGIGMIRAAGGVAVLAHPTTLQLNTSSLSQLLKELINGGLQGMECFYSTHTASQTADYRALAAEHGLIATVGSDFHGERVKPAIGLGTGIDGNLCIKDSDILLQLQKAIQTQRGISF